MIRGSSAPQAPLYAGTIDSWRVKLARVMERLGIEDGDYESQSDRRSAQILFTYKGHDYTFGLNMDAALRAGREVGKRASELPRASTDLFAMLVLGLEDLARLKERGIYELSVFISGLEALPAAAAFPEDLRTLGFQTWPSSVDEVKARYRALAAELHPDAGGSVDLFVRIREAAVSAEKAVAARVAGARS